MKLKKRILIKKKVIAYLVSKEKVISYKSFDELSIQKLGQVLHPFKLLQSVESSW